ncbi:hypothetical protein [Rhodococcus sp. NPDC049939]|uniref:hypothetical protein n=1 Tax=Rhodococcus sp. NPDC049939 TaxID=3155511 RepID=UPI0033CD3AD7
MCNSSHVQLERTRSGVSAVNDPATWGNGADRGYADVAVTPPLTDRQIATQFPTLGIRLDDPRPHIREYRTL